MKKKISEAEDGSRNILLTTNLAILTISKLFGLLIKAGNIKLKKKNYLMQVCRQANVSPKPLVHFSADPLHFTKVQCKSQH